MEVLIDGIKYVPKAEVATPADAAVAEAVREIVSWVYLRDKPDNHLWDALRALAPDLCEIAAQDPSAAFDAVKEWKVSGRKHYYDYAKADHTVDIVVFGLDLAERKLKVLLIERGRKGEPFYGHWALPGGFVDIVKRETSLQAAHRELQEETGVEATYIEQLYSFDDPDRDPRGRVFSTAHFALLKPEDVQVVAADDARDARWFPVDALPPLAFDHAEILDMALRRLRGKLRWQPVGVELLPPEFTLGELLQVYEIILSRSLDDRNFRRRVLSFGVLQETGNTKKVYAKQATLYRFDPDAYENLRRNGLDFEV